MLNGKFESIFSTPAGGIDVSVGKAAICMLAALLLGCVIAVAYLIRNRDYSKSFVITLILLPAVVQSVILLVSSNIGMGIAVVGTFSLVRFRSVPGTAREICAIFFAMAVGLAAGAGQLIYAVLMTVVFAVITVGLNFLPLSAAKKGDRQLIVVIPESLNYIDAFTDLFQQYTKRWELQRAKTTNLGSMFEIRYEITLADEGKEKEFLDALRCRNGNLPITCGKILPRPEVM